MKRSFLLNGEDEFSYKSLYGKEIDYNNMRDFEKVFEYFSRCIDIIKKHDKTAKFMLYNQATAAGLSNSSDIVCVNDIKLLNALNNKPKSREVLKGVVNLLEYKYLTFKDITLSNLNKLFNRQNGKYVVQQPVGFGGEGTFLFDESNILKLNKTTTYSCSIYIENSIPINNTFMISNDDILIFEGSKQIINVGKELRYDGYDFDSYNKLPKNLQIKIYQQTQKIAKKLQSLGYRGVGGVDYIIDQDGEVYFMEINPRFQASSGEIDKALIAKGLPSIFELNYLSFYDAEKFKRFCKSLH